MSEQSSPVGLNDESVSQSETRFYHLQTRPVEQVLPQLLTISLKRKWRVLVQTGVKSRVEEFTEALWTYDTDSFLPHGSAKDGKQELQPIWIADQVEEGHQAQVLILLDQAENPNLDHYDLVCRLFDGHDEGAVQQARLAWKQEKEAGRAITYWQQDDMGKWAQKAQANKES